MRDNIIKVKKVFQTVPIYSDICRDNDINIERISEFKQLPFMNKQLLSKNIEKGISAEYFVKYLKGELQYVDTSGSTGDCLRIYWSTEDLKESLLPLWIARKKRYGISSTSKFCYFYTMANYMDEREINGVRCQLNGNMLGFNKSNLNKEQIKKIYIMINDFQPEWLILQPSMAMLLINFFRKIGIEKIESIRYIELTGEFLKDYERKAISEFFGCNVANQYGCNEVNSIAYECKEGNLHCFSSNVYVEIIQDGINVPYGEIGDIYITSLKNRVMPFVRYEIGDRGKLLEGSKCKCGNCNPILELVNARKNDLILKEDGTVLSADIFVNIFHQINRDAIFVIGFKIIQYTYNDFLVKLVLNYEEVEDIGYDETDIEHLFLMLAENECLGYANFEFKYCTELFPDRKNGKLKFFECLIQGEDNEC